MRKSLKSSPLLIGMMSLSLAIIPSACSSDDDNGTHDEATPAPLNPDGNITTALTGVQADIETVGMDIGFIVGVGGFLYSTTEPVLIFKDGSACRDMEFLVSNLSQDTHRSQNPEEWTSWRREAGRIQLLSSDGEWENLGFTTEFAPLAKDTKLDRSYSSLSGGGNVATGGSTVIAIESSYTFSNGGRFIKGRFVGSSSEFDGVSTSVSSIAPNLQGSYTIDGYLITFQFDDGTSEVRTFVMDLLDPEVFWLNDTAYSASEEND
ncbi:MAG: hypothetical protein EOP04_21645 [Proteobacteria bacterium]|nr:MAG: hypothetical protein EOP04_21645 [Pseudomonadota bacterium]